MSNEILYKYLDYNGGLMMLKYKTLQFTNATKFNDPFDCDPALFDYSHAPTNELNWPPAEFLKRKAENDMENLRNRTWICCLSKVYDSLLMWAYYTNHKGICIGLNKEFVLESCQRGYMGLMFPFAADVQYKDIHDKPNYFKDNPSFMSLLTTKAKNWEHEQEVRLITNAPLWINGYRDIPKELRDKEMIDGKEVRHYPQLSCKCFESLYLGIKLGKNEKERIIEEAQKCNSNIKIYQMAVDPETIQLKSVII